MDLSTLTPPERSEGERRERAASAIWHAVAVLYRRRWFVTIVTGIAAVAAVVISLLLPEWYRASTRVLLPSQDGSMSATLSNLSSAAASLLGTQGGDYIRYLAILNSQTVLGKVVDEFDLVEVYETADAEAPRGSAIDQLLENTAFVVDDEFDYLSIEVLDQDPQRAAEMANYFVAALVDVNNTLSSQSAGLFRSYVESRYLEADAALDSVLNAMQGFQREYGVYDLPAQTQQFLQQLGALRGEAIRAEVQYEALRSRFGEDNEQVSGYRDLAAAADRAYREALRGQEVLMPVPQDEMPDVMRRYIDLERERLLQAGILEAVAPIREQARFEEQRTLETVQVLDAATPPVRKALPRRSVLCIVATLSAFALAVLYVLLADWWRQHHADVQRRFRSAVADAA